MEKQDKEINRPGKILRMSGLAIGIIILLGIDFLVVRSAEKPSAVFEEIGRMKMILLFICNLIFLASLIFGEKICRLIAKTRIFRVMEWLLLILTPGVLLLAVQMIVSFGLHKTPAIASLAGLLERVLWFEPAYIIKNLMFYGIVLLIMIIMIRKINIACFLYSYIIVILALINFYVTQFRGQPFMLLDILGMGTAADVVGGYKFQVPVYMGMVILGVMTFADIQLKFQRLELGKKSRKNLIARWAGIAVIAAVLAFAVPVWWKSENVLLWNINKEYAKKGYLYMLAGEGKYFSVEKPENYSTEAVDEITEQAEEEYEQKEKTDTSTVQPTNIIMIMNESLADFENVGEIKTGSEILPFIRGLNQNVKHGQIHVHTFGGGTARSEYEALTGNSMAFLPAGSVPYQLYVRDPEYGIADILKAQGYETIAMHPNRADNWNRAKVYPSMGFDQFISKENWGDLYRDKIRLFESDKSTYDKIISLYEEKDADQKLFTFCVTMQNHGGFGIDTRAGYEPTVKLNYDTEYPMAETYLSLARESDSAFQGLLEYFEKVKEPTMIVMFGDHWPILEDSFYSQLLGKDKQNLDLVESQILYTTPYVIWTNYPSDTVEEDISSNYLGSYVMEQAGVELPQYHQFLLNLKDELPVIGVDAVEDKNGNWYSMENLPEKYQKLMNEYSILQYNGQFEKKQIKESAFQVTE